MHVHEHLLSQGAQCMGMGAHTPLPPPPLHACMPARTCHADVYRLYRHQCGGGQEQQVAAVQAVKGAAHSHIIERQGGR